VVWFGEALPESEVARADEAVRACEVMLVAGTSGVVEPAASFARWAGAQGASVVEVNLEPTPLTRSADVSLFGRSGEILPRLLGD
jgi:NAD-dependent deacetylase